MAIRDLYESMSIAGIGGGGIPSQANAGGNFDLSKSSKLIFP
jgi:hypothetical protein